MQHLIALSMPWWEFILRAVAVYLIVLALTRLSGKRSIGQSTPFDILVIVLLGEAVQNSLIGEDTSLLGGVLLASTLLGLNWLVGFITARSKRIDTFMEGVPVLLARDGIVYWDQLKRCNVSPADLEAAMRKHECTHVDRIDMAMLEVSGEITIQRMPAN